MIVALPPASITLSSIPRYKTPLASAVSTLRLMCVQLASLAYAIFLTCRIDEGATHVMSSDTSSFPKVLLCVICSRVAHVSHDRNISPLRTSSSSQKSCVVAMTQQAHSVGETFRKATRTSVTRLAAIRMPCLNHPLLAPPSAELAAPPEHRESAAEPGLAGVAKPSVDGSSSRNIVPYRLKVQNRFF